MRTAVRSIAAMLALQGFFLSALGARPLPSGFQQEGAARPLLRADGLVGEARSLRRGGGGGVVTLVSFFAEADKVRFAIRDVGRSGPAPRLYASGPCPRALLVANGGFYVRDAGGTRPLGLLRVGGRTLSPVSARKSGGFLVIEGGRVRVLPRGAAGQAAAAAEAVESTPVVEEGGASGIRSDDRVRFDRIGIGVTKTGEEVVVAAFGQDQDSVSLFEFEQLAAWVARERALELKDLIAMDGGPSAHIHLPGSGQLLGDRGFAYLPDVICVSAR